MFKSKTCKKRIENRGSTLVEMIVCFALIGIFMTASTVVITSVTSLYYDVKGETYARQVSDIVLRKIAGEIEGARVYASDPFSWPIIYRSPEGVVRGDRSGETIELYDRTDTLVQLYAEDGLFKIRYLPINPDLNVSDPEHYDKTIWTFDEKMYQGFMVKSLRFVAADQSGAGAKAETYENTMDDAAGNSGTFRDYPVNVIGVYLTLESPQYGEFYSYRYMRMYNLNEQEAEQNNLIWYWPKNESEGTLVVATDLEEEEESGETGE